MILKEMDSDNRRSIIQDVKQDFQDTYRDLCCCCIQEKLFLRCLSIVLTVLQILLLIFQSIGSFKKEWVILNNSTDINDFNDNIVQDLQFAVLGILIILLVGIIVIGLCICGREKIGENAIVRVCFTVIVPFMNFALGIIGITGCIMIAMSKYENGASFYMCLSTSVVQLVYPVIVFLLYINQRNDVCGVTKTGDDGSGEAHTEIQEERQEESVMDGYRPYGSEEYQ